MPIDKFIRKTPRGDDCMMFRFANWVEKLFSQQEMFPVIGNNKLVT